MHRKFNQSPLSQSKQLDQSKPDSFTNSRRTKKALIKTKRKHQQTENKGRMKNLPLKKMKCLKDESIVA